MLRRGAGWQAIQLAPLAGIEDFESLDIRARQVILESSSVCVVGCTQSTALFVAGFGFAEVMPSDPSEVHGQSTVTLIGDRSLLQECSTAAMVWTRLCTYSVRPSKHLVSNWRGKPVSVDSHGGRTEHRSQRAPSSVGVDMPCRNDTAVLNT